MSLLQEAQQVINTNNCLHCGGGLDARKINYESFPKKRIAIKGIPLGYRGGYVPGTIKGSAIEGKVSGHWWSRRK